MTSKTKAPTEREIYSAILDGTIDTDVLIDFAQKKMTQIEARNERAKAKAAEKRAQNDELMDVVLDYVSDKPKTREQIFNDMSADGVADISIGKIGYRLTALSNAGTIVKSSVTIPSEEGGRARKVMAYALA